MTILAKKAFISSESHIVPLLCSGRILSNVCSMDFCLFYIRQISEFSIKQKRISRTPVTVPRLIPRPPDTQNRRQLHTHLLKIRKRKAPPKRCLPPQNQSTEKPESAHACYCVPVNLCTASSFVDTKKKSFPWFDS